MILFVASAVYALFLLGYEAWAVATGHRTITSQVRGAQAAWTFFGPLFSLVLGGLLVHFFWLN